MKIETKEDGYTIYVRLSKKENINFTDQEELENYFRQLFINLKDYYNIELSGFYNIHVYYNQYYGVIIDMSREEIEYFDYFDDKLDMKISISKENLFLYKLDFLDFYCNHLLTKSPIYEYLGDLYINLCENLSNIDMGRLLESSTILYGEKALAVVSFGNIIK